MKALMLRAYNELVYQDVPDPQVGPQDVLIRVKACGICGSDVHGLDGSTGRRIPPLVMGHEATGAIEAVGDAVTEWHEGDRVTFDSTIYCGECPFCREGRVNLCDDRRVLGVSCDEYRQHGAFAEFVAVPQRILYRLPEGLSFERACLVEPLAIAAHAVKRAHVSPGATAVVWGAGLVGLLALQVLKAMGCGPVFAVDVDEGRLGVARDLGADEAIHASGTDALALIRKLTRGVGADVAIEAVGLAETVGAAMGSVKKGGSVALIGNLSAEVPLPLQAVVTRELSLLGSCASCGEYGEALDLIARGRVAVDPLISASAPLAEGRVWFERLRRKAPGLIKVLLVP